MSKAKVLFLCVHNSARSQIAEAYLNQFGRDKFIAESAGLEAGVLNPFAIEVMKEEGIDISLNPTKNVKVLFDAGKNFDFVITVCDANSSEKCPVFPGPHKKLHWDIDDPASYAGTREEKLKQTRMIRDEIKQLVLQFIAENKSG